MGGSGHGASCRLGARRRVDVAARSLLGASPPADRHPHMGRGAGRRVGVNLRDLFPQHPVPDNWYDGQRIAVDGHNVAFRYLTSIRARDGDVLRNADGRVTSHLYGFLGLVKQLRERGAEPIVVWDGPVHPRKQATVDDRIRKREEAVIRAQAALDAGDMTTYRRVVRATTYLDGEMIADCTRLLEPLGVAVTTADHDGERFAAALCQAGHADAVATEDFDALVAGAPAVLRKAGGQAPFMHHLGDLETHGLDERQLRQVAVLCGTDWHPGVRGFGAKTAVRALQDYPDLGVLFEEVEAGRQDHRFHQLVAASDMDGATFRDLEAFIADVPKPEAPARPKPCPEVATETAVALGIGPDRAMACFT